MSKNYFWIWLALTVGLLIVAPTVLLTALKLTVCPGMSWALATSPIWGVMAVAALLVAGGIVTLAISIIKVNLTKKNGGGQSDEE